MRKAIVYLLVGLVIITVISLFTLTGPIARYAVQKTFEPQKLTLSDSTDISYDPFVNELTIKELTLLHEKNNTLLKLDRLVLEIDILPLFSQRLQINSFQLFGLETSIKQVVVGDKKAINVSPEWLINGWSTNNLLTSPEKTEETAAENPTDSSSDKPALFKEIVIENLQFENINVSAELPTQTHQLSLNQLSLSEFTLLLDENSKISDLQFELSTRFKSQNTLELEDDEFFNLGTKLTLEMKPVISFSEQDISISNEQPIELTVNKLNTDYKAQDINASLANFTMSLSDVSTVISQNKPSGGANAGDSATQGTTAIDLDANLEWALADLIVNNFDQSVEIFSLGKASIEPASVSFNNSQNVALPTYGFKTNTFELQDLSLMKFLEDNKPTLSVLEKLVVTDIDVSSEKVELGLVQVGKLNNNILINEAKELANLYLPNQGVVNEVKEEALGESSEPEGIDSNTDQQVEKEEQQAAKETQQSPEKQQVPDDVSSETPSDGEEASQQKSSVTSTIPFQLKEVVNIAPITLNTVDMSVSPVYRSLLEVSYLSLQNIDTQSPEQKATLTINATNNKYAKIDVNAQSQPFAVTPTHDIQIDLAEIDMASISPYISGALGYHINSGQMDSKITAQVEGEKIDGNADLLLRTMDLTAISNEGEESSVSGGAISFNYALGMLKDGDGNVDLSVPFSGDLNNPSVGFSGFLSLIVKRATMSAAKDYLINTFVPYANVVNFALSASKHILKLRFNDLVFTPKQTELSDSQKDTLSQLAQVLNKHESVTIKICAISNPSDLIDESPVDAVAQANTAQNTAKDSDQNTAQSSEQSKTSKNEASQSQVDSPVSQVTAKSISATQVSTLLGLAQDRANQVKSYLVNEGEVASKRLSSCSPTISYDVESAPKVTFDQIN